MSKLPSLVAIPFLVALAAACSDSDDADPTNTGGGGDAGADVSPGPTDDAGNGGDSSAPNPDGGCTAAAEQLLGPIDAVSTGAVSIIETQDGITTLYVDASAGGVAAAASNPRVYLSLARHAKVDVTDKSAASSTEWDLALKRTTIFTNGGQGGPGQGEAAFVPDKAIDAVTSADVSTATFGTELFLDAQCEPQVDETGAVKTSFDGWYDYEEATHYTSPRTGTWLVKGVTGQLYKVQLVTYFGRSDGTTGEASGRFVLKVGAL